MEKERSSFSFQPAIDRLPPADQHAILGLIKAGLDAGVVHAQNNDLSSSVRLQDAMHALHGHLTHSAPQIIEPVESWMGISMDGEIHDRTLFSRASAVQGFDSEARFRAYAIAISQDRIPQEHEASEPSLREELTDIKNYICDFAIRIRSIFRKK